MRRWWWFVVVGPLLMGSMILLPQSAAAQQRAPSPVPCAGVSRALAVFPTCTPTPTPTRTPPPTRAPTFTALPPTPTLAPAGPAVTSTPIVGANLTPTPTPTPQAGSGVLESVGQLWPLGLLALLVAGIWRMRPHRKRVKPAARPALNAVKDLGHQSIALDRPALAFRSQFGSGDQFEWNPHP
jgi:hypothetical protein